ncbi:RDD family protein [Phaeacidiphilus oryzae]|uniref:RDD family protein n=1 Tax=Phaeacidiphilus oryzae TaxID=348818 RepID=UPI000562C8BB|nr:RDD family protein [Phaeacidiphilus oryzae]
MDDSRKALGGWINGPGYTGNDAADAEFGYRGKRLGLPEEGSGSLAGTGRRVVALLIDWWLCALISYGLVARGDLQVANLWAMLIFFVMSLLMLGTVGCTPGKRLLGLRVVRVQGGRATPAQVALRTFLLMLAIPALVWDRDGRGLHDKAVGTAEVRF